MQDIGSAQSELLELKNNDDPAERYQKLILDLFWQAVIQSYPTLKTAAKNLIVM